MSAKSELREIWARDKRTLGRLWFMGALTLMSYAIARPACESLFLASYGASALPYAWLAVAGGAALTVIVYNRVAAQASILKLFGAVIGATLIGLGLLLAANYAHLPGATLLLYVWKDVYIVVLVETFWSFANCAFSEREARLIYGSFLIAGTFGELLGARVTAAIAPRLGTAHILWFVMPLLAGAWLVSRSLHRVAAAPPSAPKQRVGLFEALALLRKSPYLGWMVALVITVQLAVTLIDYQFNGVVEHAYPITDERTAVMANVYGAISLGALLLQFLAAPILRFIGVGPTLLAIPVVLAGAVAMFAAAPRFLTMAAAKVASKAMDYSLFRAGKEILYIPLGYAEKTRGKAVVDIFTYRFAKGGASLFIVGLAGASVIPATLALLVTWVGLTFVIVRKNRQLGAPEAVLET